MPKAEKSSRSDATRSPQNGSRLSDSDNQSGRRFLLVAAILVGALVILAVALFELAMVYLIA